MGTERAMRNMAANDPRLGIMGPVDSLRQGNITDAILSEGLKVELHPGGAIVDQGAARAFEDDGKAASLGDGELVGGRADDRELQGLDSLVLGTVADDLELQGIGSWS